MMRNTCCTIREQTTPGPNYVSSELDYGTAVWIQGEDPTLNIPLLKQVKA
jgi:hypothetical protein